MSRSLERAQQAFSVPALVTVFTVPAGHKYEVNMIAWQGDLAHAQVAYCFYSTPTVTYVGFDQFNIAATKYAEPHVYDALVLYAGDSLNLWHAAAAGTAFATINYVDVDYTT